MSAKTICSEMRNTDDICRYENCDGFDNTEGVEGPYVFSNRNEGTYYFVCGVRNIFSFSMFLLTHFVRSVATVLEEIKRQKSL